LSENHQSELSFQSEAVMLLVLERLAAGQTVKNVRFQGVSMLPMLRQDKDCVELSQPPKQLKKYDLPVYRGPNGKYVMHRVVGACSDFYTCLGDNTYHYEKVTPERMVAVVSAFTRNGRRISVENRMYRFYCGVWCAVFPVRRFLKHAKWRIKRTIKKLVKR